jgi:hypothetical protein
MVVNISHCVREDATEVLALFVHSACSGRKSCSVFLQCAMKSVLYHLLNCVLCVCRVCTGAA